MVSLDALGFVLGAALPAKYRIGFALSAKEGSFPEHGRHSFLFLFLTSGGNSRQKQDKKNSGGKI